MNSEIMQLKLGIVWVQCWVQCQLRLVFPILQQNASPSSILPVFLTTLGRKLDNGDAIKDLGG